MTNKELSEKVKQLLIDVKQLKFNEYSIGRDISNNKSSIYDNEKRISANEDAIDSIEEFLANVKYGTLMVLGALMIFLAIVGAHHLLR